MFYFLIINTSKSNANNSFKCSHYTLESLIHQITKYHIDIQTQLAIANIDDSIINRINSHSAIMIDVSSFEFNRNYSFIIKEWNQDDNDNVIVYLVFYVVDIKQHQYSFMIYQLFIDINNFNNDPLTYSGPPINISINEGCSMISKRKIQSLISKVGVFEGNSHIINIITFNENYFELVIINLRMLSYRRLSSNEWLNQNDITPIKENKAAFISDIFLIENQGKVLIIMNFIYIFILNIQSFTFSLFSIENKVSYYLDLNRIFTGEYNKCLYLSLIRMSNQSNEVSKEKRDIWYQMIIKTKKATKYILLVYNKYQLFKQNNHASYQKAYTVNINTTELSVPLSILKNKNLYYNHLSLITNLYHSWKNNNFKAYNYSNYNYLCSLYENNSKLLLNAFKSKVDQLNVVNYLSMFNSSGIFLSYFQHRLLTLKYLYFLNFFDFTHIETVFFNELIFKDEDNANADDESNDRIVPYYQLILKNIFLIVTFTIMILNF